MSKRRPPLTPVSEEILHRHVAQFLDVALQWPWFWSTIPSGGGGRIRGARLKAMGLKKGMPDLIIFGPGGKVLGIELKREGGSQSAEQKAMAENFKNCGCWYVLARSVEEVQRAVHFVTRGRAA